jgi:hypothetical protein
MGDAKHYGQERVAEQQSSPPGRKVENKAGAQDKITFFQGISPVICFLHPGLPPSNNANIWIHQGIHPLIRAKPLGPNTSQKAIPWQPCFWHMSLWGKFHSQTKTVSFYWTFSICSVWRTVRHWVALDNRVRREKKGDDFQSQPKIQTRDVRRRSSWGSSLSTFTQHPMPTSTESPSDQVTGFWSQNAQLKQPECSQTLGP